METSKVSSYIWLSPNALRFNSVVGAVGLGLAIASVAGAFGSPLLTFPDHIRWIVANLIFFNTLHVAFTLVLLRASGDFQLRLRRATDKKKLFLPSLLFFSAGTFLLFFTHRSWAFGPRAIALFMTLVPQFHVLAQHKGLCLNMMTDSAWRNRVKSAWRYAIYFLLLSAAILMFRDDNVLRLSITALAALGFFSLTWASWMALKAGGVKSRSAYVFQLKLLMFPLIFVSDLAAFIVICLHGIEYISVVTSVVRLDSLKKDWPGMAAIFLLAAFVCTVTWLAACEGYWTSNGVIANAFLMATVVVHYGLDGVLFRSAGFYSA